jgi:hypothetical protein
VPHPITFYLQGDEMGYRPVDFDFYGSDSGSELIEGVFQDEGPLRRPEVLFRIFLPPAFDSWEALNLEVRAELQKGEPEIAIVMSNQGRSDFRSLDAGLLM